MGPIVNTMQKHSLLCRRSLSLINKWIEKKQRSRGGLDGTCYVVKGNDFSRAPGHLRHK